MPLQLPMVGAPTPTLDAAEKPEPKVHRRFDRAARLIGEEQVIGLSRSRVVIFGVGGVGSFAAEALARSNVGCIALVDFDQICVTNANRQLHALKGTIGKYKVDVMAERLQLINPLAQIEPVRAFYNAASSEELLSGQVDYMVDAIDNMTAKTHLLATCIARGIRVVSSMGAAARMDPTRVKTADLAETTVDPFARAVRKLLRQNHGIELERGRVSGVTAVFSDEEPIAPTALSYDTNGEFHCVCPNSDNGMHTCERRNRIEGSVSFVTGAFGLATASVVVRTLAKVFTAPSA